MKSKTPLLIALFVGLPCLMPIVFKPMVENASPFMGMPIFIVLVGLVYIVNKSFLINLPRAGLEHKRMTKYIISFMFAFSLTFNLLETLTYVPGFNLPNLYIRFWLSLLFSVASIISMDADEKEYEEWKKEYEERKKEYEERRKK